MIAKREEEGGRDGAETTEVLEEGMVGGETVVGGTTVGGATAGDASREDAMADDETDGTAMLGPRTRGGGIEAATTGMRKRHRGKRIYWPPKLGRRNSRPLRRLPFELNGGTQNAMRA